MNITNPLFMAITRNILLVMAAVLLFQACGPGADEIRRKERAEMEASQRKQQEEIMVFEAMERIREQSLAIARGEFEPPPPDEERSPVQAAGQSTAEPDPAPIQDSAPAQDPAPSHPPMHAGDGQGSYTVQVAALDTRTKAEQEMNRWKQRGYNQAFISRHGNVYRVRLGRYELRDTALGQMNRINNQFRISAWIDLLQDEEQTEQQPAALSNGHFTIQVAALDSRNAADEEVRRWVERGFDQAYAERHEQESSSLYRIRLGNFETRHEARDVSNRVNTNYGITSWVVEL